MDDSKDIEKLERTIKVLRQELLALKEENETLWAYLEEDKASKNSLGDKLVEIMESELQDEWLRHLKPIGEA